MFEVIRDIVCDGQQIPVEQVFLKTRKSEITFARQVIMALAYKHKVGSCEFIGTLCGNRDHATVFHACNVVKNYIETDPMKAAVINMYDQAIKENIKTGKTVTLIVRIAELEKHYSESQEIIKDLEDRLFKLESRLSQQRGPKSESVLGYSGYREHSR